MGNLGSSCGFLIRGLITNNSFSSLVGTGSYKHVVGLDALISLFSSSCPILKL